GQGHAARALRAGVGPGEHRRPLGRHRPARPRRGARLRGAAQGVRQADRRVPGGPAAARHDGDPAPGRAAHGVLRGGRGPAGPRRRGDRHGEDLLLRGRAAGVDRGDEGPRRLRLLHRVRGGAALPRRDPDEHRRGHQRRPADGGGQVPAPRRDGGAMTGARLPRSYLYVPGNAPDTLGRALTRGADALIVDLEDAVPANAKNAARRSVAAWLGSGVEAGDTELWVRINGGETGHDDVRALAGLPALTGLVIAKAEDFAQ